MSESPTVAQELRQAAEHLRAVAAKATHNICPDWTYSAVRHIARNCDIDCLHDDEEDGLDHGGWGRYNDSPWITLMGPDKAEHLADILEAEADCQDAIAATQDLATSLGLKASVSIDTSGPALAFARSILGTETR